MKIKKNKNEQEFFRQLLNSVPDKVKRSVRISMDIATQINYILKAKGITQRKFADLMGKRESEISKWLSGNHNFTTKTLGNIEAVLGEDIINVPLFSKSEVKFIPVQAFSKSIQTKNIDNIDISNSQNISNYNKVLDLIINCKTEECYGTEKFN